MPCEIIGSAPAELERAAAHLSAGGLVALPTETVYGLGGNAWLPDAVENIFVVKGRPPTDPLICHVDQMEKGLGLWATDDATSAASVALATCIGKAIWPGPLTIVCRAHSSLPTRVTGGSGYVGLRIPNHPVAQALLRLVSFPVAAPSANTFGHVSPTSAKHVYDDLALRDPALLIIDGGKCGVGIESTVIKVLDGGEGIEVLRRGRVTVTDLKAVLSTHSQYSSVPISIRDTRSMAAPPQVSSTQKPPLLSSESGGTVAQTPMDGPGQLLTHYSPRIPASLLTPSSFASNPSTTQSDGKGELQPAWHSIERGSDVFPLSSTVVIDYNGVLAQKLHLRVEPPCGGAPAMDGPTVSPARTVEGCFAYMELSGSGNATEASNMVFEALRWSEEVGGSNVVFPLVTAWGSKGMKSGMEETVVSELLAAVEDRLFRAASGVVAYVK